jgi:hypothetical protein
MILVMVSTSEGVQYGTPPILNLNGEVEKRGWLVGCFLHPNSEFGQYDNAIAQVN